MRKPATLPYIRTRRNIRTMQSLLTSLRPQRFFWPRLRETEMLRIEAKQLSARRGGRGAMPLRPTAKSS